MSIGINSQRILFSGGLKVSMVYHSQRMGGHACHSLRMLCHTYLPISEKDIDRGSLKGIKLRNSRSKYEMAK